MVLSLSGLLSLSLAVLILSLVVLSLSLAVLGLSGLLSFAIWSCAEVWRSRVAATSIALRNVLAEAAIQVCWILLHVSCLLARAVCVYWFLGRPFGRHLCTTFHRA